MLVPAERPDMLFGRWASSLLFIEANFQRTIVHLGNCSYTNPPKPERLKLLLVEAVFNELHYAGEPA